MLLADDYAGILTALRRLLEPSCDVVGSVGDGMAVVEAAATLRPDVVVVDLAIPRLNGLEACRRIKDARPETKVVILTATVEASYAAVLLGRCLGRLFVRRHAAIRSETRSPAVRTAASGDGESGDEEKRESARESHGAISGAFHTDALVNRH